MNRILSSPLAKVCLFVLCLIPVALLGYKFYANDLSANPIEFIEHYTGDWAIRLLLVTLCVTPLRKLTGLSQLSRFRRMLGLYAFFYAVLHFLTYLLFDQQFDFMAILGDISKRRYITVGFLGWVCMAALAMTSTAGWVRRMNLKRWQRLHKLVYLSAAAAVIHYYWRPRQVLSVNSPPTPEVGFRMQLPERRVRQRWEAPGAPTQGPE